MESDVPAGALEIAMPKTVVRDRHELERSIGYRFLNSALLDQALTHATAARAKSSGSYQRLEFLGDRVLGLVVADMLFEAYPAANEGELSKRLSDLVRRETCADVGRDWGLATHIRLGRSEASSGGSRKIPILADACEAVIGAVFLDGGFAAAKTLVRSAFEARMRARPHPSQDAKTALQEWAQARGLATPVYQIKERYGPDHAPRFKISVEVDGFEAIAADAGSKRAAEQGAAQAFLLRQGLPLRDAP
jgi:ribonuclease-3